MTAPVDTLPFPPGRPSDYLPLADEPSFVAGQHLALEMPTDTTDLATLGYQESDLADCASTFAVSNAFRILSTEGVAAMRHVCDQIYHNRNANEGTGANRLGSYARGAGYRSQFIRDFCDSPELAAHLSDIARIPLGRHSVPAVACGINYAPEDISRAIDTWHVDSVAFDIVMMITDPSVLKGGEFQYFHGTKQEGQALLGITGEEGVDNRARDDGQPRFGWGARCRVQRHVRGRAGRAACAQRSDFDPISSESFESALANKTADLHRPPLGDCCGPQPSAAPSVPHADRRLQAGRPL